jgi:hypothetical protein
MNIEVNRMWQEVIVVLFGNPESLRKIMKASG